MRWWDADELNRPWLFFFTEAAVRMWAQCCLDLSIFLPGHSKIFFFKLDSYTRLCIKYTWLIKHTRNQGTPLNPQLKSHIINVVRVSCVTLPSHMHPTIFSSHSPELGVYNSLAFLYSFTERVYLPKQPIIWLVHWQGAKYKNVHNNMICISRKKN